MSLSVALLAPLASQHHNSEYNRQKFGPHGSPVRYIPLSVHLPDNFKQLLSRQAEILTTARPWWLSNVHRRDIKPPLIVNCISTSDQFHNDLMAAMDEPLHPNQQTNLPAQSPLDVSLKTSFSHPINISAIIAFDVLPLISSHAMLSSPTSLTTPTVLEIPPSFTLHRLSSTQDQYRYMPEHTPTLPLLIDHPFGQVRTRSDISEALQSAIDSALPRKNSPPFAVTRSTTAFKKLGCGPPLFPDTRARIPIINDVPNHALTLSLSVHVPRISGFRRQPSQSRPFILGNLFLSSCPGKKVRLQGPVKGRSGVCRDLESDLKRIKDLRVGCIICCLDDDELDFLGVSWSDYKDCAQNIGLDVLRLPTPEGLAPLTPDSLDTHLTDVINNYTLRGIPVLVHCRGGVGRAGVIACCWIIKLGLCGWVEDVEPLHSGLEKEELEEAIRKDSVKFVERVISFVRKRRSMKAIETYEQVRFLVVFVEYLRQGTKSR